MVLEHFYAVDADAVWEVIDPQTVTPLPFVSVEVEGLINASGRVIPQIYAARCFNPEDAPPPDGGVVMILSTGHTLCACRVSRVIGRSTIATDTVSHKPEGEECAETESLFVAEFYWNETLVMLLDTDRLTRRLTVQQNCDGDDSGLVSEIDMNDMRRQETIHVEDFSCLVVSCNGELFALRFEDVIEVVESGPLTPLPGAPAELSGVVLLRGAALPVLSLRSLLFGGAGQSTPFTVLVELNGYRIGLQVDRVLGIRRFACDSLRQFSEEQILLEGFVTTPDEKLVALLRLCALAEPERFDAWRAWLMNGGDDSAGAAAQLRKSVPKKRLLLFRLGKSMMALPLESIERVEEYFEPTVTPGDESAAISGVIQVHGQIVPVRLLEQQLGISAAGQSSAYLIIAGAGKFCAVPVDRIERIFDMEETAIELTASSHGQLLSGIGSYNGTLVSLLDGERLVL